MSGRRIAGFLLILNLGLNIHAEIRNDSTPEFSTFSLYPVFLGLSEVILSNDLIWVFNRYVSNADYGMISFSSVRKNLTYPWVWDQDEFSVNHIGHPYQGSIYYGAGRSAGSDFYVSSLMTVFGSLSWELLMETETPSINDLLVTTTGGIALGEMFFRISGFLSDRDRSYKLGKVVGAVISPYSQINRNLLNQTNRKSFPLRGYYSLSSGYSYAEISRFSDRDSNLGNEGISILHSLYLDYGDLFRREPELPYDWFSMKLAAGAQVGESIAFTFDSEGYLAGSSFHGRTINSYHNLGVFLHYDFLYNEILNMASNSLGPGWVWQKKISEKWLFESRLFTNYVIIGASELVFLKYTDIEDGPPSYERRNYSLASGLNGKLSLHLSCSDRLFLDLFYLLYDFRIIESSIPENGSDGNEIIEMGEFGIRYILHNSWFLGVKNSIYHKRSFYNDYANIDELLLNFTFSAGISF